MLGRVRCPGAPPVVTIILMIVLVSLWDNHWLEAASSVSVSPPLGPAAGGAGLARVRCLGLPDLHLATAASLPD